MNRQLDITDLEPLREYLSDVKNGDTITIVEAGTPVAALVPAETSAELSWRAACGRLADYLQLPPFATGIDVVELLRQERDDR
jgi:prevent-host-death family protein